MPSDILQVDLENLNFSDLAESPAIVPADLAQLDGLARAYFAAYPADTAAESMDDAQLEIQQTFAGEFGSLLPSASFMVIQAGRAVGGIFVVERSIWDQELDGPFVIDLFLMPEYRGRGIGKALVRESMRACQQGGSQHLSLRIGEGTSDSAMNIYQQLGFSALED